MADWLFKTEPDEFSIQNLQASPEQTTRWDGIRNYQARNFIRDTMKPGDRVLIYHSRTRPMAVVGTARVVTAPYADPAQFNPESDYFDPKSSVETPRWFCVDVQLDSIFKTAVTLDTIKITPELAEMVLLKQGRLSIQPVTAAEFKFVTGMGKSANR